MVTVFQVQSSMIINLSSKTRMEKSPYGVITSMELMGQDLRSEKICSNLMVALQRLNGLTHTTKSFLFLLMKMENIKFNKIVCMFGREESR